MSVDPLELFGEALMTQSAKHEVIGQIVRLSLSKQLKQAIYKRWAERVGVPVTDADLSRVAYAPKG